MLDCLREVDPKRARYYDDLQSKYVIEDNLTTTDFTQREVDFSGKVMCKVFRMYLLETRGDWLFCRARGMKCVNHQSMCICKSSKH